MNTKTTIDNTQLAKLLAMPQIKSAFAEATAAEEASAAAARKAVLDEKAEVANSVDALAADRDGLGVEIAQRLQVVRELQRRQRQLGDEITRQKMRHRRLEVALRDEHGGAIINHVANYLRSMADQAEHRAEFEAARRDRAGESITGKPILKPSRAGQAKAEELRHAVEGLRAAAESVTALEHEPVAPQELRRQIQAVLEGIGLTLYTGDLPEHMLSRQVHAQGEGQHRSVEQLASKIAA